MLLSESEALEVAKNARTVAVVGMTDGSKPGRASFDIPLMLEKRGYKLTPINPMIKEALGHAALGSVKELPSAVDIVDVFRRPEAIPELADELISLPKDKRPAVVWIQTGIRHPEAEQRLEAAGFKVVADRCLGVFAARVRQPQA